MKSVLVIGLGRFGRYVAEKMIELNHEVMAIDNVEEHVNKVLPWVTNAQIGDCTDEEFLSSLGVRNFDLCIVAIGDDFQSSLEVTSLLKELGAKMVVSRASRPIHEKFLLRNGADEVVFPERQLANWTAIRYSSDQIMNYVELGTDYAIYELELPSSWVGKTLETLDIRKKYNLNILGIRNNGRMEMNVSPSTVFQEYMTILVLGNKKDVKKYFHL